jgi:hypothetical protein
MSRLKRCLLITLMLILLPLRGWAGNIMAVEMAAVTVVKANVSSQVAMPADCPMHVETAVDETSSACNNCDTCELCVAIANLAPAPSALAPLTRQPSPLVFSSGFTSAASASDYKPPIF